MRRLRGALHCQFLRQAFALDDSINTDYLCLYELFTRFRPDILKFPATGKARASTLY